MSYALAIVLGLAAGVLAGMFGVGGGLLFVPTLLVLGLSQHEANYGNVRWRAAAILGVAAAITAQAGVALAEALPATTLRRLFAGLLVLVAAQIVWRARRSES